MARQARIANHKLARRKKIKRTTKVAKRAAGFSTRTKRRK